MSILDENCSTCELFSRFDLSCRHRMICAVETWLQLPSTLFYPRWFIDGPPVLHVQWIMIWDANANPAPPAVGPQARVELREDEMLQCVCTDSIVLLGSLPPGEAEGFAVAVHDNIMRHTAKQAERTSRCQKKPLLLQKPAAPCTHLRDPKSRLKVLTLLIEEFVIHHNQSEVSICNILVEFTLILFSDIHQAPYHLFKLQMGFHLSSALNQTTNSFLIASINLKVKLHAIANAVILQRQLIFERPLSLPLQQDLMRLSANPRCYLRFE